jgi:phosphate transport system permease protein
MKISRYRDFKNKAFYIGVIILSGLTAAPLIAILAKVIIKGWQQINFDFFTQNTPTTLDAIYAINAGEIIPGGIANGIIGMLLMVLMASAIAIPVGIICGIFLSENPKSLFASIVRFLTDVLQGVPSIVVGIIVYIWIVIPMKSYSAVAGGIALSIIMLPLIVRSTEETLKMLPAALKEAGLSLGASYSSVVFRVMLPSAFGGIFTGILLAISRVIGETAPLMLTALGSSAVQWDVTKPSSSVSLLIWEFYNDPNLQNLIWSASLFLLMFVLILNIFAKRISNKWRI